MKYVYHLDNKPFFDFFSKVSQIPNDEFYIDLFYECILLSDIILLHSEFNQYYRYPKFTYFDYCYLFTSINNNYQYLIFINYDYDNDTIDNENNNNDDKIEIIIEK